MPGKQLITADTLSQAPMKDALAQTEKVNDTVNVKVLMDAIIQSLPATEARLEVIREKQKAVLVWAKLIHYMQD